MSYRPKVYTIGHVLGMTGIVAATTAVIYVSRHRNPDLVWFIENVGLYIGIACTVLTFLFGLSILGTRCYDEETNRQLEAEHDRAVFEWNGKSPEERAIITAARQNELLQLTQILQYDRIIRNQEALNRNRPG
ncbi:hypothetical protein [Planctellipticum variicoloris]|uniref:hypothetical protein n=1 Tax=Planctellipticum variicoloris TaxID=3064265 RepID=UPI0030139D23|nr:hypothetical protein SH412_003713 [Planctomycetaceae bacterium SH412]